MFEAKIIADSIDNTGNRVTSFVLTYPRIIHSEFLTHRVFSRNSSSSRAIPVNKLIDMVEKDLFVPVYWGKNKKGMQAHEEISDEDKIIAKDIWISSANYAINSAKKMADLKVHKQIVNRILEPYSYITTIVTGQEFNNFYNLRANEDAQPEFELLAYKMLKAHVESEPKKLDELDWHLPFGDKFKDNLTQEELIKVCIARCARVSYLNFDGQISKESDIRLFEDLKRSGHFPPMEHVRQCLNGSFVTYRKTIPNENQTILDRNMHLKNAPDYIRKFL